MNLIQKLTYTARNLLAHDEGATDIIEKYDDSLSPNMRALRLSMSIADTLLSMGVAASDVASMALDITDVYCKRPVQVDISSTILMFSQDRGNDREPLTLIRTITPRGTNNRQIQTVQELVRDIEKGHATLDEAETRFDDTVAHPKKYPLWLTIAGSAIISGGVGMLLLASPIIIAIMVLSGALVASLLQVLARRKIPAFFSQVGAAMLITLTAALVAWLSRHSDIGVLEGINPNYIVIGGIVMLVAGLTIVGAVQDAIDEFYVTANARLLKVVMMTAGIVAGVVIGLYFSKKLGVWINLEPTVPNAGYPLIQYVGALFIASGFAISNHSRPVGIMLAGALGATAWFVFSIVETNGFSVIAASAFAATAVGSLATLLSRVLRVPSISLTSAGIVPLVPGITLFNGLMQTFTDSTGNSSLDYGLILLVNALFIALAIAGGASFGNLITRPLRRTLIRARNSLPYSKLGS